MPHRNATKIAVFNFNLLHLYLALPLEMILLEFRRDLRHQKNYSPWAIVRRGLRDALRTTSGVKEPLLPSSQRILVLGGHSAQRCRQSNNFDQRQHRHHVTPRGGEWVRPILTQSNTCFLGPT